MENGLLSNQENKKEDGNKICCLFILLGINNNNINCINVFINYLILKLIYLFFI